MRVWLLILIPFIAFDATLCAQAPPSYLPKYDVQLELNANTKLVTIREHITWTNPAEIETSQLTVNFYPRYTVPKKDELLLKKTMEMLRLTPSDAMNLGAPAGSIDEISMAGGDGRVMPLHYEYQPDAPTAVVIDLPQAVPPGGSVSVTIDCRIRLPNKQGRWGHWKGVHYLANSLPSVAYFDREGWHAMPFVPWHQPFWNEAGQYTATMTLPQDQVLACSATTESEQVVEGRRTIRTKPFTGRDFTLVSSAEFREFTNTTRTPDGRDIKLSCFAFARHQFYAEKMMATIADAIPIFAKWFGPFPYDRFTLVESYFGWNGNESAGLVMIDERVFDMPQAALGYVEYLVSHETCHQWWYNLVGTNGYAETFVDEGAATYFTHKMLDIARGPNNHMVKWDTPYTPRIKRENYRFSSMLGAIGRDNMQPAAATLPAFGNLHALFTGAYDRGSKVFGLIADRLGEASFNEFIAELVKKYSWRVLTAAKLKKELEDYTGKNWDEFFERWVYGRGLVDWSVTAFSVEGQRVRKWGPQRNEVRRGSDGYRVTVEVKQSRDYDEPTTLGFRFANRPGTPLRIPISSTTHRVEMDTFQTSLEPLGNGRVRVQLTLPDEPIDVTIDPDHVLLDADLANNSWKFVPKVQLLPVYSMIDDTDLTNDYDRWNFKAGLWAGGALYTDPWYTRGTTIGARAGAYRTQQFQANLYSGYRTDFVDLVVGTDGLIDHFPFPKTQVGYNFERRIATVGENNGQETANRAVLFGRYTFQQGSSLYLPPISYLDLFTAYQDNFLPFSRRREANAQRPGFSWLSGLHYRLNLYTPYWDPEEGWWVDLTYAAGIAKVDRQVGAQQFKAELATVQKLPEGLGYLSDVRFAGRGSVGKAWPERGEFFTLGGSSQFRGFDLREKQGSFYWLANAEARLPIVRDLDWNFADRVLGVRNIWLAGFYDVGGIYTNGNRVGDVAHALGIGLRVNVSFFSFIEQTTIRLDAAKTINAATPFQFWFGAQHPF